MLTLAMVLPWIMSYKMIRTWWNLKDVTLLKLKEWQKNVPYHVMKPRKPISSHNHIVVFLLKPSNSKIWKVWHKVPRSLSCSRQASTMILSEVTLFGAILPHPAIETIAMASPGYIEVKSVSRTGNWKERCTLFKWGSPTSSICTIGEVPPKASITSLSHLIASIS